MSLIVETGTASSTSEAYATVSYADTYHAAMGNTLWATLQTAEKEQALRRAATFMCQVYRMQWKGVRVNSTQALDWPRYNVQRPDLGVYNVVDPATVPIEVQQANAELALNAASEDLNPVRTQGIISKEVGPLKVVYDPNSPSGKQYSKIGMILLPLLDVGANGANVKLRRV
jgi:hypothetical protein